jgi:hypothetical protein
MAAKRFWQFWDWGWRINDIAGLIQWLIYLSVALGGIMTWSLWSQVPWQYAVVTGILLFAGLIVTVTSIGNAIAVHSIAKKIAVSEFQVLNVTPHLNGQTFAIVLTAHLQNRAIKPIWFKVERVNCHIDMRTHEPSPEMQPLEIQPDTRGSVPVPPIIGLRTNTQQLHGRIELEVSYGKKIDKLKRKYKTNGQFTLYTFPNAIGILVAVVVPTGARAEYS